MGDVSKAAEALKQLDIEDKFTKLKNAFPDIADDAIRTALGMSDIGDAASKTTDKLDDFIKASDGAASSVLSFAKSHAMLLGGTAIVAVIARAISAYNKYKQTMIETASEATSTWNASKTSLREYATQYEELKIKLDSGDLSEEETLSVKKEILDIQQKITSEYGNSVSGIDLVNGSLETQLALLQQISQEEAQTNINENRQSYQDAEKEMQEIRAYELGSLGNRRADGTYFEKVSDEIAQIVDGYEELLLYNAEYGDRSIRFIGDAEQAKEVINKFSTDIEQLKRKYGEDNSVINSILNTSSDALLKNQKNVLDKYQENYHSFLEQQLYSSGNGNLLVEYGQAISDYNNALMSGDVSKIKDAETAFNEATKAKNEFVANKGDEFNTLFDPLLETLDTATLKYIEFNEAIEGMADDDNQFKDQQKEIKHCADEIESYEMYATEALDALINGGHDASDSLWTLAQAWGGLDENSSTEEMNAFLDVLVQAGVLSADLTDNLNSLDSELEKVQSRFKILNQLGAEGLNSNKHFNAIAAADETRNAGDDYVQADTYLDEAKEMYDKGLIGTDDFKARAAYFSPTGATDPANFIENYKKAKNYLTENAKGLLNFLNDLEEKGLASSKVLEDGTKEWSYTITDFEEAAQKMGIGTEFLVDMFGRLEDYGFHNNFASNVEDATKKIIDTTTQLAIEKAKLAEMEATGQYTTIDEDGNEVKTVANQTAIDAQREKVAALKNDLLELQALKEQLAAKDSQDYAEQIKTAKEVYTTLAEERKKILEENTYGEDTKSVAALLEAEMKQIAQENKLNIDGELNLVNVDKLDEQVSPVPVEVQMSVSDTQDVTELSSYLSNLSQDYNPKIIIDIQNQEQIDSVVQQVSAIPENTSANLVFSVTNEEKMNYVTEKMNELNAKRSEDNQISYSISIANSGEAISNVDDIDNKEIDNKNYDVSFNYQENISKLNTINQKSIANKEYTVTQRQKTIVESPLKVKTSKASGTLSPALASGTAYNMLNLQPAYAGGRDVAIDKDQVALVNELPGHEGIIRNGQLYKIPGGMHYQNLKQGDIVLSASQMEQLERTGRASGKGQPIGWARSFAQGTLIQPAYASGSGGGSFGAGGSGSKSGVTASGTKATSNNTKAIINNAKATNTNTETLDDIRDWAEIKLDRISHQLDEYISLANDYYSAHKNQNKMLDLALSQIQKNVQTNKDAYSYYMALADKVSLSANYKNKVKDGTISIETITDENLKKQIEQFQEYYEKAVACRDTIIELNAQIKELAAQKAENIIDDYDTFLGVADSIYQGFDSLNNLANARGESTPVSNLETMLNQRNIAVTYTRGELEELTALEKQLVADGVITKWSQEWYALQGQIQDVYTQLYDFQTDIYELQQQIREVRWEPFTKGMEEINAINDNLESTLSLISDLETFGKDSDVLNINGKVQLGLLASQLGNARKAVAEYENAFVALNKELANGNITQAQYKAELQELTDGRNDAIASVKEYRDSILSLVKEGIEKETDAMRKLIDARKEDLQAQKESADYARSLAEKTSAVNKIKAQIAALEGDDSASARAQKRNLQNQLREAQEELDIFQEDHMYDELEKGLDDAMEKFEETQESELYLLNSSLEAQNEAIANMLMVARDNYQDIYNELNEIAEVYGYKLSEDLVSPWTSAKSAIAEYKQAITDLQASININTEKLPSVSPGTDYVHYAESSPGNVDSGVQQEYQQAASQAQQQSSSTSSSMLGYVSGIAQTLQYGSRGDNVRKLQNVLNALGYNAGNVDGIFGSRTQAAVIRFQRAMGISSDGVVGKNTKAKFRQKGYASGTTNATSGWHLTDENGEELIFDTKQGKFRMFAGGEMVFTHEQAKALWEQSKFGLSPTIEIAGINEHLFNSIIPRHTGVTNNFESFITVQGNVTEDVMPKLERMIDSKIQRFDEITRRNIDNDYRKRGFRR